MGSRSAPIPLAPGDVLLFRRGNSSSIIPRLISWVQGNRHVHVAVVIQGSPFPFVAEADSEFNMRIAPYEVSALQEHPVVVRPSFDFDPDRLKIEAYRITSFGRYSYLSLVDALINHGLGRVFGWFGKTYTYRTWWAKNPFEDKYICSTLVSYLFSRCSNQKYDPTVEPDSFTTAEWTVIYPGD